MFGSKEQEIPKLEIPKLETHAGYAAAVAKLQELYDQCGAAERRLQEINADLARAKSHPTGLDAKALRLLEGESDSESAAASELRKEFAQVSERRQVLARAVELQNNVVDRERYAATRVICTALEPQHRANVKAIAEALIALARPNQAAYNLHESLVGAGCAGHESHLRSMYLYWLGDPHDWQSRIAKWFMEAFEYGFISESEVPTEWRTAWWKKNGWKLEYLTAEYKAKHESAKKTAPEAKAREDEAVWTTA